MSKNPIDRVFEIVLRALDHAPYIVAGITIAATYGVDAAPVGVRGAIVVAAILATFFVAYGAGKLDDIIEQDKREREARRL